MTSRAKFTFTFFSLFLFFFIFQVEAQTNGPETDGLIRVIRNNWVTAMEDLDIDDDFNNDIEGSLPDFCLALRKDNHLYIGTYISMADNNLTNFPAMHIQYQISDVNGNILMSDVTNQITTADLILSSLGGIPLYRAIFILDIDLSSLCTPNEVIFIQLENSLVTPYSSGGYDTYPVADYPVLFPPAIFNPENLPVFPPPVESGGKFICCNKFTGIESIGMVGSLNGEYSAITANSLKIEEKKNTSTISPIHNNLNVSPNPFQDKINISIDTHELKELKTIQVFNALGNLVANYSIENIRSPRISLNSEGWNSGMYYMHFNFLNHSIIRRVIKN